LARSAKISHEADHISITYHLSSADELYGHFREVAKSPPEAAALAHLMPNKAIEKFDDFASEQLIDEANARSRLDIPEACAACASVLAPSGIDTLSDN